MSTVSNPTTKPAYPATLEVDYPEGGRNRLTSFFRIIVVIPIAIILGLLTSAAMQSGGGNQAEGLRVLGAGGILFMPLVLMILFRKKYPKWWFDWNLNLTRFSYRVSLFLGLLRDEYPSTDEEQAVHLNLVYPDARTQLGRGWPLIKWFLAIPHYIVLAILYCVQIVVCIIAWFAILFTGRYPRGLFDYTVGVSRWALRVEAYAILLITDQYPPFSLS